MVQVILASSSASRLRLLESAGITPKVLISGVDARCKELSGKSGYLHTGHCLIDLKQGIELSERSTAKVQFAQMTEAEIIDYVDSGEPLNVAGGFTLDGLSAPFITNIEGDPSGIIGLSLPLLRKMIISLGYSWPELKNK